MKIKLFSHQQKALNNYPNRYGLWWSTGLGKTYMGLALIEKHLKPNHTAIVLCPKIVKFNWEHHIKEQGIKNTFVFTKEEIVGKRKEEMESLKNVDVVIVDEFHFWLSTKKFVGKKKRSGKLTIAGGLIHLLQYHKPTFVYPMTATPYRSSPNDLFTAWKVIKGKEPMKYPAFKSRYFTKGPYGYVPLALSRIGPELKAKYRQIGEFLKSEDVFDLPPILEDNIYFQPTVSQLDAIRELQGEQLQFIQLFTKSWQILNGTLKGDEYEPDKFFSSDKFDWSIDYIKENSDKNIFFTFRHNLEIQMFKEKLTEMGVKFYEISGAEKPDFQKLNQDKDRYVILGQISSLVGFDIMNVDIMVHYSVSFSYVDYQQARGRITRGKDVENKDSIKYINLIVAKTIDEKVFKNIMGKKNFVVSLYKGSIID